MPAAGIQYFYYSHLIQHFRAQPAEREQLCAENRTAADHFRVLERLNLCEHKKGACANNV